MFRAASSLRIKPIPRDYYTSRSASSRKCKHSQSLLEGSSCEQYRARSGFSRSTHRWGLELLSLPNSIAFYALFHLAVNARDLSPDQARNRTRDRCWNILRNLFVNVHIRPSSTIMSGHNLRSESSTLPALANERASFFTGYSSIE